MLSTLKLYCIAVVNKTIYIGIKTETRINETEQRAKSKPMQRWSTNLSHRSQEYTEGIRQSLQ